MDEENYYERYDMYYDLETGEFLEKICSCDPKECQYKEAYLEDGCPTKINLAWKNFYYL